MKALIDCRRPNVFRPLHPAGLDAGPSCHLAGLIVSFFLFGFFNPYWRVADQDILLVFDAFLQNDGLPRQVDFHPAHLIVAMLSATYRALHGLGLLETYSLSTMPLASDVAAFTRSWTSAVQIARLLCLLIVLAYVTAFAFLLRALVADWRVALLGTFATAFSGGIAMSVRTVKPELLSGAFFSIALLILLISARSPRMTARPMLIGIAAFLATLAMDNKVQAIFLISTLPVLLLPFGEPSQQSGFWTGRRAGWALAISALFALFAAIAAAPLVRQGLLANDALLTMRRVFDTGVFQTMLIVWIASGMVAFGLLWRARRRPDRGVLGYCRHFAQAAAFVFLSGHVVDREGHQSARRAVLFRRSPGLTMRARRLRTSVCDALRQHQGLARPPHVFSSNFAASGNFP